MLSHTPGYRPNPARDLVAASLLTSDTGAEVHLVSADGQLLRVPTDEATARRLVMSLWQALEQRN